jgi:hypothetical protein
MKGRELKQRVRDLLTGEDPAAAIDAMLAMPARQVVNPLFSFFYSGDPRLRWRAVDAMGAVVADLAEKDVESARVVMRRLMWNLNDESGGIGWGSPEAMGEIAARSGKMAREFGAILISYADEAGNYLEHPSLQRGVLWGLGRLAHARPDNARGAEPHLRPFLLSPDPWLRGLAAWAAGPIAGKGTKNLIQKLVDDTSRISLYRNGRLVDVAVGELAREALRYGNGPKESRP